MIRTATAIKWDCDHCEGFYGLHLCTAPSARFAHAVSDVLSYIPASTRGRFLRTLMEYNADMQTAIDGAVSHVV